VNKKSGAWWGSWDLINKILQQQQQQLAIANPRMEVVSIITLLNYEAIE
jgi:hypothetical protein